MEPKMATVSFKHGQRYGMLPRTQEANPITFVRQSSISNYEPVVLTLPQCVSILANLGDMHRVLVLADAATGLRVSEILALRWCDVDWDNSCIRVTRAYVYGRFGPPKSRASKRPVPMHTLLAALLIAWPKGDALCGRRRPYLSQLSVAREEAVAGQHARRRSSTTGCPKSRNRWAGRFSYARRTLASALVANGNDPWLVQELLQHANVKTTLELYTRAATPAKIEAQGWILEQLLDGKTRLQLSSGE
jgi:integrase